MKEIAPVEVQVPISYHPERVGDNSDSCTSVSSSEALEIYSCSKW